MAWAAIGIVAPASSTAPCRAGRQSAATMTTAANAIITATFPAITRPGLEKALPAVSVCTCPAAVRSVKLSHDGANAAATPRPASTTMTTGPSADPRGRASAAGWAAGAARDLTRGGPGTRPQSRRAGEPADEGEHQARAAAGVPRRGDGRAGVGEEQAERDRAQPQAEQRADPQAGAAEQDEHGARGPGGQVDGVRDDLVGLLGEAGPADVGGEEPGDPEDDRAEQRRRHDPAGLPAERPAGLASRGRPAGARGPPSPAGPRVRPGGVFRPTGTIVSGASMVTNLVHAAVQPSGVSGHRSSGRDLGPPTVQTP